eukprot:CCRYP_008186-RA/>CCRYP_008186-RA protein AED:0.44 eAED:0.44 QI:0/-1/0/1/-1/1/1/0/129
MRETEAQVIEHDFRPPIDAHVDFELFVGTTLAEQNDGTIYTDQRGNFPITSYYGNRYQFVAYKYRSNATLVRALQDLCNVYEYLTERGFQPKLNVMDNQCRKAVKKYIQSTKATIQLVNPDNHRVNAAE